MAPGRLSERLPLQTETANFVSSSSEFKTVEFSAFDYYSFIFDVLKMDCLTSFDVF